MKIAIFHDYIGGIGGGEKLILTLARGLNADVITTDIDSDAIKKMGFEDINIISLGDTIKFPPFKQISASLKFALCDFSKDYDFFIFSGNWAHFAAKKHKPNMMYCFTPPRVFYDLYKRFLQNQPFVNRQFFKIWVKIHRKISLAYINHVEHIVSISKNVQTRIKKYYKTNSIVIYPAIDISKYKFKENGDFWLSVNRLYPEKRVDLQINAFRKMPEEKLIIVGGYTKGDHSSNYINMILNNAPPNIKFLGNISEKELIKLYATCKGFITTALDEDFGMTPIEAMASGKPVIAVKEGGYLETIVNNVTGILIDADEKSLIKAVKQISSNPQKYKNRCEAQAKKFDINPFIKKMRETISLYYGNS